MVRVAPTRKVSPSRHERPVTPLATYALLATTVAGSAALVLIGHTARRDVVVPIAIATVIALGVLVAREARRPTLSTAHILGSAGVLCAVAVVRPPIASTDVWSYAVYGRMVSHYGLNPYTRLPAELLGDPFLMRVAPGWWATASVYGPGFTALAAAVTALTGPSLLATRLVFQLLAAATVLGIGALLVHARVPRWMVVATMLNPLLYVYLVNQGHNDGLVGLPIALAAVALARRRIVVAGLLIAVAASVKLVGVLALGGAVVWLWRRGRRAEVALLCAAALVPLAVGYAAVGGVAALRPLLGSNTLVSRASPWGLLEIAIGRPGFVAVVTVVVVAVVLVALVADRDTPYEPVVAGVAAYLLAGAYVLPWYLVWALPLAALSRRAKPVVLGAAASGLLLMAYQYTPTAHPHGFNLLGRQVMVATQVIALGAVAATLLAIPTAARRLLRRPPPVHPSPGHPAPVGSGSGADREHVGGPRREVDEQPLATELGG